MGAVDDFLGTLDPDARAAYERILRVADEEVPGAEQGTSYGVPALKLDGCPLLGFRVAKTHLSVFPFSSTAVDTVRDRLEGFDLSKGTIRFSAEEPLPDDAVRALVRGRIAEIERR